MNIRRFKWSSSSRCPPSSSKTSKYIIIQHNTLKYFQGLKLFVWEVWHDIYILPGPDLGSELKVWDAIINNLVHRILISQGWGAKIRPWLNTTLIKTFSLIFYLFIKLPLINLHNTNKNRYKYKIKGGKDTTTVYTN